MPQPESLGGAIGIGEGNDLALRDAKAGVSRGSGASPGLLDNARHTSAVLRRKRLQCGEAAIGRAVVHQNNL
jgi:hypothetical protein